MGWGAVYNEYCVLQALALEVGERAESLEAESVAVGTARSGDEHPVFYEITIASVDQPKLLSRLSEALVRHLHLAVPASPADSHIPCCSHPGTTPNLQ